MSRDGRGPRTVVLLDADTVAGWRRPTPSLGQLHSATEDLRRAHPGVAVAVLADPSLKWALPDADQDAFERDVVSRAVVCAPAGTRDGTHGWMAAVAAAARANGDRVLAVTDRAVGGVPVARLGRAGDTFTFDLDGAREVEARPPSPRRRRSGRR